jgi:hypothetical protein
MTIMLCPFPTPALNFVDIHNVTSLEKFTSKLLELNAAVLHNEEVLDLNTG